MEMLTQSLHFVELNAGQGRALLLLLLATAVLGNFLSSFLHFGASCPSQISPGLPLAQLGKAAQI